MRLGIVLNNLGSSQQAFMAISYINTLLHNKFIKDATLFYCENVASVIKPLCMSTSVDKVFQFDGTLITTNLYTYSLVRTAKGRKVLYLWDLEWLRGNGNYIANNELLNEVEILICRSDSHAKCIENYCNRKPIVIPNFNLKMIVETINEK